MTWKISLKCEKSKQYYIWFLNHFHVFAKMLTLPINLKLYNCWKITLELRSDQIFKIEIDWGNLFLSTINLIGCCSKSLKWNKRRLFLKRTFLPTIYLFRRVQFIRKTAFWYISAEFEQVRRAEEHAKDF